MNKLFQIFHVSQTLWCKNTILNSNFVMRFSAEFKIIFKNE